MSIFGGKVVGANRLNVTAIAEDAIAAPGNGMPTYIVVSVTDVNGAPVTGLKASNFEIAAMVVAPCGASVRIQHVAGGPAGLYNVSVVPISSETWKRGVYVYGVTVRNNEQRGQTLASVMVD